MSSTTLVTERTPPAVVDNHATLPQRVGTTSRLPSQLRFPILLALDMGLKYTMWSVAASFLPPELGRVSKIADDDFYVAFHAIYKVVYMYFTWKASYDWMDVAALTTLTSVPYAYLLNTYYAVSPLTTLLWTAFEVAAIAFPTYLLRPLSPIHRPHIPLRNRFLLESFQVQTCTSALAVGVYTCVLWIALKSGFLNVLLVSHLDIPTVVLANAETPLTLITKLLPIGVAARAFLLNPSIGAQTQSGKATPATRFDGETASLKQTLEHNFWDFSTRTRTLIKRTAIIVAFMGVNTVHRMATLQGSDYQGGVGYAGLWVLATVITSAWWAWVGAAEGAELE